MQRHNAGFVEAGWIHWISEAENSTSWPLFFMDFHFFEKVWETETRTTYVTRFFHLKDALWCLNFFFNSTYEFEKKTKFYCFVKDYFYLNSLRLFVNLCNSLLKSENSFSFNIVVLLYYIQTYFLTHDYFHSPNFCFVWDFRGRKPPLAVALTLWVTKTHTVSMHAI